MAQDVYRYDRLVEDALRGVVRDVLKRAAREGLKGDHHFFIAFDTRQPGVVIPEVLRSKYPEEMTIVLQHQFWDLEVDEHGLAVTLSFQRQPERLHVPFAAVRGFTDPSVGFQLAFTVPEAETSAAGSVPATIAAPPRPAEKTATEKAAVEKTTAEVVTLDSFRKR